MIRAQQNSSVEYQWVSLSFWTWSCAALTLIIHSAPGSLSGSQVTEAQFVRGDWRMSKRRCVELKICQTISCSAPVSRRNRAPSPAAAAGIWLISDTNSLQTSRTDRERFSQTFFNRAFIQRHLVFNNVLRTVAKIHYLAYTSFMELFFFLKQFCLMLPLLEKTIEPVQNTTENVMI